MFSVPRVVNYCPAAGLRGGWSLDIQNADGVTKGRWDLTNEQDQRRALQLVRSTKPKFIILSPACGPFSLTSRFNYTKPGHIENTKLATEMLEFSAKVCQIQAGAGRYFVLEHPAYADSWGMGCLKGVLGRDDVGTVKLDMCMYGMEVQDGNQKLPAKKPTRLMSNSPCILNGMVRKCDQQHHRAMLLNHKSKPCEVYPAEFCRELVKYIGLRIKRDEEEVRNKNANRRGGLLLHR